MTTINELSDDELALYAKDWRQRALRGDKAARGVAHALETEFRRRGGSSLIRVAVDDLDTRPTRLRGHRPWWRFWEG